MTLSLRARFLRNKQHYIFYKTQLLSSFVIEQESLTSNFSSIIFLGV